MLSLIVQNMPGKSTQIGFNRCVHLYVQGRGSGTIMDQLSQVVTPGELITTDPGFMR